MREIKIIARWKDTEKDDYELVQFTGLKDIHGTEIYIGDILIEMERGDIYEVREGWFEDVNVSTYLQMGIYLYNGYETRPFYRLNYEVIGNIYEESEFWED